MFEGKLLVMFIFCFVHAAMAGGCEGGDGAGGGGCASATSPSVNDSTPQPPQHNIPEVITRSNQEVPQKNVLSVIQFRHELMSICKNIYPEIITLSNQALALRATNCSILCIYHQPTVLMPDGSPCHLKINFFGTPGTCRQGVCEIEGKPFSFDPPPPPRVDQEDF